MPVASKKQILQRLLENEHITFDEMWVLLQEDLETKYIVLPQQNPPITIPYTPPYGDYNDWIAGVTYTKKDE